MSAEATVRAALVSWVSGLTFTGLSSALTVTAESPEPGDVVSYPACSAWFPAVATERRQPEAISGGGALGDGRAVLWLGTKTAEIRFFFEASSYADAEIIRSAMFRAIGLLPVTGETGTLDLSVTLEGTSQIARVYWSGDCELASPAQTATENLWALVWTATADYPWIERQEDGDGIGTMDVTIDLLNTEADPDAFDLNDYEAA